VYWQVEETKALYTCGKLQKWARWTSWVDSMPKALAWCPYQFNGLASGGGTGDGCITIWNIKVGTCTRSIETKALASYALWDLLLTYLVCDCLINSICIMSIQLRIGCLFRCVLVGWEIESGHLIGLYRGNQFWHCLFRKRSSFKLLILLACFFIFVHFFLLKKLHVNSLMCQLSLFILL
jgi:hypothetical protein